MAEPKKPLRDVETTLHGVRVQFNVINGVIHVQDFDEDYRERMFAAFNWDLTPPFDQLIEWSAIKEALAAAAENGDEK